MNRIPEERAGEVLEALDNVTAALETCLACAYEKKPMTEGDYQQRSKLAKDARQLVDALYRPSTMIDVLVITADGQCRQEQIAGSLDELQRLVGGDIESIPFGSNASAYVDEDGIAKELTVNAAGTKVWHERQPEFVGHDVIKGNLVIVGPPNDEGNETSVPPDVVAMIRETLAA